MRQPGRWDFREETRTLARAAERAEHAAIPRLRPGDGSALPVLVEVEGGVRRVGLACDNSALRTGDQAGREGHRMPGILECGTQYASRMTTSAIKVQMDTVARCGDGTSIAYDPTPHRSAAPTV